jgi:hypothetical protein
VPGLEGSDIIGFRRENGECLSPYARLSLLVQGVNEMPSG